jgi:predicted thioesterase
METLTTGIKHAQEWVVEEKHTTQRGKYRVFSTPAMTQLVESTANQLVVPHLKPGQGQVGVLVTVRHMGPTPMGKKVRAEAELIAIDRRKLSFKVKVYDDAEQVGEADHDRFVIDLEKYYEKLRKKLG